MSVPERLRTERLILRPWAPSDAGPLHAVLAANAAHLGPWIPPRVASAAPPPELARRLEGFATDFAAAREWRWGLFDQESGAVLGEVGLYPRVAGGGRVPYAQADCVEIGYWLRADATGRGLATEAARAALDVAAALPTLGHAEIRCDARNAPSAAVPRRLGFTLAATVPQPPRMPGDPAVQLQVWTRALTRAAPGA